MAQFNDSGYRTFVAGEALEAFRLVKCTSAETVVYSDNADTPIGVTTEKVASGAAVNIALINKPGTVKVEVTGAITDITDLLYSADDGKAATSGTVKIGNSLAAASGAGSIVELILSTAAPA